MSVRNVRLARQRRGQSGFSIVATIITLLMLSVFVAVAVSLVTTGSTGAVQGRQGVQALFIADGGLQYTVRRNRFPNYGVTPAVALGEGSFSVSVPTLAVDPVRTSPLPTLTLSSTEGFITSNRPADSPPAQYWVMLCAKTNASPPAAPDLNSVFDCEKISFTAKASATTFTTGTRGRDSSSLPTAAETGHPVGSVVLMYAWDEAKTTTVTARTFSTGHLCSSAATTICVASTANFASSGFVRFNYSTSANENNIEDVFYSGIGSGTGTCGAGCTACLGANFASGSACVRRAYDGNGTTGTTNHASGTVIYQSEISVLPISTGVVSGNPFSGDIKRSLQISVLPLR
jgi:hypothetical protein